ncbi:MAG: hypothetical protein JSR90_06330 [Proteobacteria bacterium]|nr:hypothetical protein [Pseudomonadota bacterium]
MKTIERVQTGIRIEKRLLKVMKALAESLDMPLGELIEGVLLHALEGKTAFQARTLDKAKAIRAVYELDLTANDAHKLSEAAGSSAANTRPRNRRPAGSR